MMEPWGWIWMLVWIAALSFMVWLIVRSLSEYSIADDAMVIIRARFARGEINQDEFERAKAALLFDKQESIR